MSDINLLPDDLRKKEEAERQASTKSTPPPFTWREPTLVKPAESTRPPAPLQPIPKPPLVQPQPRPIPPQPQKPATPTPKVIAPMQQPAMRPTQQTSSIGVDLLAASGGRGVSTTSLFNIATTAVIVFGVTLMLIVGGWLMLRQSADARAERAGELESERMVARKQLAEVKRSMETMKNLVNRLTLAHALLDGHPAVGKLFTFLEKETHANIQLTSIVMRPEENRVLLEVITQHVPSLVGQLLHWAESKETVAGLTVTSVTRQERPELIGPVYAFDATIEFVPSFFHPFIKEAKP